MRTFSYAAAALFLSSGLAAAAEPTGEWMVKDKLATVRIENCNGAMWGVVTWERQPGVDSNNPDPRKRSRPTLGMPILLGMKKTEPNRWEGEIYNPNDGRNYSASISVADNPDVLHLQGCVLGFLCGGEDWTRVKRDQRTAQKAPTAKDICSNVTADLSGSQRR